MFIYTLMDYHLLIRNFSIAQSESLFEIGAKRYSTFQENVCSAPTELNGQKGHIFLKGTVLAPIIIS